MVLASDTEPPDLIRHIPDLCVKSGVPYIFIHSKHLLGQLNNVPGPVVCCCVLATDDP